MHHLGPGDLAELVERRSQRCWIDVDLPFECELLFLVSALGARIPSVELLGNTVELVVAVHCYSNECIILWIFKGLPRSAYPTKTRIGPNARGRWALSRTRGQLRQSKTSGHSKQPSTLGLIVHIANQDYSIDAPPSNTPAKPKYCDITGFPVALW